MDRIKFYDSLRDGDSGLFGGSLSQEQVDGIEGILAAMSEVGDGRAKTLAYALATAYHETGRRMVPVREGFAKTDAGAVKAVAKLAKRLGPGCSPERYGKPSGPQGQCYYGRGHVQLTWHENYVASSADAGVDLERNPDKMLDPVISARILIKGLIDGRWNRQGKGLEHYLPENGPDNLKGARRTVNITDKWDVIARYYQTFFKAIEEMGGWPAPASSTKKTATQDNLADRSPSGEPMPTVVAAAALPQTDPNADFAAWVEDCPGDIRMIGNWLAAMPGRDVVGDPVNSEEASGAVKQRPKSRPVSS